MTTHGPVLDAGIDAHLPSAAGVRGDAGPESTPGLTVIALLLALVLGLSAADIQSRRAADLGPAATELSTAPLDGRGKWGGYL